MRYRLLGTTGVMVSELALGTMTWGGGGPFWSKVGNVDEDGAARQLKLAVDAGVNLVDTADVYSFGRSEELLGSALRRVGVCREDLIVATKARLRMGASPNRVGSSRKHLFVSLDASLKRLGLDHVDIFQLHGWDPVTPIEETLDALADLVRAGRTRYIGLSNFAAWQAMRAVAWAETRHLPRPQSLQVYYSLAGRDAEREIVPFAENQRVSLLVWSPLSGGLLSGKFADSSVPGGTRRVNFDFPPVSLVRRARVIDAVQRVAARQDLPAAPIALAWVLARPAVTSVILGARDEDQLAENLRAASIELSAEDVRELDEASALAVEYPAWMLARQESDRLPGMASLHAPAR